MTASIPVPERLLAIWQRMLDACTDATHADYPAHGAMGISVCEIWQRDAEAFTAWAHTQHYTEDRFLVRIRIAGNFGPENCWWVDAKVYQRYLQFIRPIAGEGTIRPLGDWLTDPRCYVDFPTFLRLLSKGWAVEHILTKPPVMRQRGRKYPYAHAEIPLGMVFGRLTVMGFPDVISPASGWKQYVYPCRCACGTAEHRVYATNLLNGEIVSCGCYLREMRGTYTLVHGDARRTEYTRLYTIWTRMVAACTKPQHRDYPIYGRRGIAVCLAWQTDYTAFRTWALAQGYHDAMHIERHDRTGDFSPDNCFFTDDTPLTSRSRVLSFDGASKTLAEWARDPRCVVTAQAFLQRMARGWELDDALHVEHLRTESKPITVFGETHSLMEWSRDPRCCVTWSCLQSRLRIGWDAEEALITPSGDSRPGIEAFGERKALAAWARDPRCVVPEHLLRKRLQQGWDAVSAITTPSSATPRKQPIEAFGESKTLQQWVHDTRCRVPLTTLRSRLKAGWPFASALTTPAYSRSTVSAEHDDA